MKEFLQRLDHPLLFLFFLLIALKGLEAVLTWGFKSIHLDGAAALMQHP